MTASPKFFFRFAKVDSVEEPLPKSNIFRWPTDGFSKLKQLLRMLKQVLQLSCQTNF